MPAPAELRFRAMGTQVHLAIRPGPDAAALLAFGRSCLADLEARWSRFLPSSELSEVNRSAGVPVTVSRPTFDAIDRAVQAWAATGGRFDPTVLPALMALGYDRSFRLVGVGAPGATAPAAPEPVDGPAPGCADIVLDHDHQAVTLPAGLALDLGGIGKGLAADLLVDELLRQGAGGACVNIGGDVRVAGPAPDGAGWDIGVTNPLLPDEDLLTLSLLRGAVTTSSRLVRCWRQGDAEVHHLIDPRTGRPADSGLISVTVVGAEAWWSEVLAKAAFVAGPDAGFRLLEDAGVTGVMVEDSGWSRCLPGLADFVA